MCGEGQRRILVDGMGFKPMIREQENLSMGIDLGSLTAEDVAWLVGVLESERDQEAAAAAEADGPDEYWARGIASEKVDRAERMLSALRHGGGK